MTATISKRSSAVQAALYGVDARFLSSFQGAPVDTGFIGAIGIDEPTDLIKKSYPIPIDSLGFRKLTGDPHFVSSSEKVVSVTTETWQEGVMELAKRVAQPDFSGWDRKPATLAYLAARLPRNVLAAAIEANATGWDGVAFFHASHPVNPFKSSKGTFQNLHTSKSLTKANLEYAFTKIRSLTDTNGQNLGLEPTHLIVPNDLVETGKMLVEDAFVVDATSGTNLVMPNRNKGVVSLIKLPELTSATTWYVAAANQLGLSPWVVMHQPTPERKIFDTSSDEYKKFGKVGVSFELEVGAALIFQHTLHQFTA